MKYKVIIVEDVKLELKGTEEIFRHEIPDAEVIGKGTARSGIARFGAGRFYYNRG